MSARRCRFLSQLLGGFTSALLLFGALSATPFAQMYQATPSAKTTDPATLHSLAVASEMHKRFALGLRALQLHDGARAAGEFTRILALNPKEPQRSTAHYDLGLAHTQLGNLAQAQAEFSAAIQLDPGFLAAMANLVVVALERKDLAAARTAADMFVQRAPVSARALYSRGLVALRSGDLQTAQADFAKLTQANPASATAHYTLAVAHIQANALAQGERELRLALDRSPSYAAARLALGTVLVRLGRRDEAREAFDLAARDASDPATRNLAISMRDSLGSTH